MNPNQDWYETATRGFVSYVDSLSPRYQKLSDIITFFQERQTEIPKVYRDSATVEFEHGMDGITITVLYQRPETEGERNQRILDAEEARKLIKEYSISSVHYKALKKTENSLDG